MPTLQNLTPERFCTALLAALAARGTNVFDIRDKSTAGAFAAVLAALDERIDKLLAARENTAQLMGLLRTRSYLAPSVIGSFDRFETCLRALQTSLVASLNPELRDMQTEITEPFASYELDSGGAELSELARDAAGRFIETIESRSA